MKLSLLQAAGFKMAGQDGHQPLLQAAGFKMAGQDGRQPLLQAAGFKMAARLPWQRCKSRWPPGLVTMSNGKPRWLPTAVGVAMVAILAGSANGSLALPSPWWPSWPVNYTMAAILAGSANGGLALPPFWRPSWPPSAQQRLSWLAQPIAALLCHRIGSHLGPHLHSQRRPS